MAPELRFDNRVAVVTGAGAGLGRTYALLLAKRGAKVVVNDLGGTRSGDGASKNAADSVVQEIKSAGGIAVPDYNSVVDGYKIVKTAIDNFGRIDILINNAGILRDKSFQKISMADWDIIQDVHVKGAFVTTQAAWEYFRKQKYGRVIFTTSNAGLFGNFGQANYSSAKMALVGLCNTISLEGKKYNINANVIAPTAASRLTQDILPPDIFEQLKPELIAPVVVWLCHEACDDTGYIIEAAGGWAGRHSLVRSRGAVLRKKIGDAVTPENVQNKWSDIINMDKAQQMGSIQEVTLSLISSLEQSNQDSEKSGSDNENGLEVYETTVRDAIIYALGIGASVDNPGDLKFLYENHSDFSAFPTQSIIPGQMAIMSSTILTSAIPNRTFDLSQVLHGEQYLEVFKPLPLGSKLKSKISIVDVLDKGKNAVIISGAHSYDENNDLVCYNELTIVVRGAGGFGGASASSKGVQLGTIPSRAPDAICTESTSRSQAALYRLSGDSNPMHIDPDFAAIGGFDKPILHGLCTLGFSARHILLRFGDNNPSYFKSIKARFVKPFIPGASLKTLMWREGNRIYFETREAQTEEKVVSGAYVDLHKVVDKPIPPTATVKLEFTDINLASLSNRVIISKLDSANRQLPVKMENEKRAALQCGGIETQNAHILSKEQNICSLISEGFSSGQLNGNDYGIIEVSGKYSSPEKILLSPYIDSKL